MKKKLGLAILLSLVQLCVFSQRLDPDTLLARGNELLYDNPKKAIVLVEPIITTGNENQVYNSLFLIGECFYVLGEFEKSIQYYQESLVLAEKLENKDFIGQSYLGLGTVIDDNGDPSLGFDYYSKALAIREEQNDPSAIANVLNNISVSFYRRDKLDLAIEYMDKVYAIDKELNDSSAMGYSLSNLGAFHYFNENNDSALYFHERALEIRTILGQDLQRSRSLNNIGNVYEDLGDIDKAVEYYEEAIMIRRGMNNPHELSLVLNNLGMLLANHDRPHEALDHLLEAKIILDSLGDRSSLNENLKSVSKAYATLGNYKEAYEILNESYDLYKLLFNESKNEQIEEMMTKFETNQTEKENEELRAKRAEDSLILERSKNRNYLLIGAVGLVVLAGLIVFGRLRINRKTTRKLQHLYSQLEVKNNDILDSIIYAKRIQKAILPSKSIIKESIPNSFIYYLPKDVVAGDFYWIEKKGDTAMFAAADCTGHGVPGAMVSVVCNGALNRSVREYQLSDPAKILNRTRAIVVEEFEKSDEGVKDGMDIALCTLNGMNLSYSGAHNPLWIVRKGGFENLNDEVENDRKYRLSSDGEYTLLEIRGDNQPIGKYDFDQDFVSHQLELKKNDTIYLFSDGYVDQFGGDKGKKFKAANFKRTLLRIQEGSMKEQQEFIAKVFQDWKGSLEQIDDVVVIGVKV